MGFLCIHTIHYIVYLTVERPNLNQEAENNSLIEKLGESSPSWYFQLFSF